MAVDPAIATPPVAPTISAEIGKPDQQEASSYGPEPDSQYWLQCLADAERAEQDFRRRGREIIQIYRNEGKSARNGRSSSASIYFNILYSNTEVMLPAVYMKPPDPVVRSRFTQPPPPPPMMPPMMPPMGPPGMPGVPPMAGPPGAPPPVPGGLPPEAGPMPPPEAMPPPGGPPGLPPLPPGVPPLAGPGPGAPGGLPPPGLLPPGVPPPMMPPPPDPMQMPIGPPPPDPADIETASAVMEKALEIVVDDEHSHEAIKTALKDVLLPGRGVCRVRWKPQMKTQPVEDPVMGGQLNLPGQPGTPQSTEVKVWELVDDEYVYWEDFLCDPVRQAADCQWLAFRHLFTKEQLTQEFSDSEALSKLVQDGKLDELLKWTDESAAKSPVGGGSAMKSAKSLGSHVRKAMAWEIWDKVNRRIIWFCRDAEGLVLRIDPDTLQLQGFFPTPVPMLAVTSSDSRIPRAYYDLYDKLAEDLDNVSIRISKLTDQVKVRGAYNSASTDIADILTAGDGKMIGVDGVDMLNGGLQNHIWLVPIADFMAALDKLFLAREQLKQQIYEVMGISDIMRGATKASETATAQRIKGSMGVSRLEDLRQQAGNFVRDLLRLKAEIIAQNFDPETLSKMTGEEVTPAVMAILRSDFQRVCSIDIEADSTVQVDEQAEQQSMAMIMQSVQAVMQGAQGMLMTGILPPNQVMQLSLEMLKMFLHPVRYSRGVVEMINQFQDQLAQAPLPMPLPPGMAPPGIGPPGGPGSPPAAPPGPPGKPPGDTSAPPGGAPKTNGGMPPPPMLAA